MKSVQEYILKALKDIRVEEAYGQYGKYTGWITKFISGVIDLINSTTFKDVKGTEDVKVTVDKDCFKVKEMGGTYVIELLIDNIKYEGDVILNPILGSNSVHDFISIDTERDSIRAGFSSYETSDSMTKMLNAALESIQGVKLFVKKSKGIRISYRFYWNPREHSTLDECIKVVNGIFTGFGYEYTVKKKLVSPNIVVDVLVKIPFENDSDMGRPFDAGSPSTTKYFDINKKLRAEGLNFKELVKAVY
jgi:hypothetical protein